MVDFKKILDDEKNAPWWAKIKKPEERSEQKEKENDLSDSDIEAIVKEIETKIGDITHTIKEKSTMPRGAATKSRNGLPFLKSDSLTTDKQKFEILWAGTHDDIGMQNKYNAALIMKVKKANGDAKYLLSLNEDSPVLKTLDENLGSEEAEWKGKMIFLFNEVHEVTEQKFMRCEVA